MNLINDILIQTGVIARVSQDGNGEYAIQWFKDITIWDIIATYVLPLIFFLAFAVYLKLRYEKRKAREAITLSPYLYS